MLRLLILGAAGRTGAHVLERARWAGHTITVVVRDPVAFGAPAQVRVIGGDVTDKLAIAKAVEGQQAVITLAGSTHHPVATGIAQSIVRAATAAEVPRLMVLTRYGAELTPRQLPLALRWSSARGPAKIRTDQAAADALVRESTLDWTLAQVVRLSDDPPVGDFRVADTLAPHGPWRISRADVARFLVDQLNGHGWSRRTAVLSNHH